MNTNTSRGRQGALGFLLILCFLFNTTTIRAQDLVPISDITGGASIFVFRTARKSAPRKFAVVAKYKRARAQRVETQRRVNQQFIAINKTAPRRTRTRTVEPQNLPAQPRTMPREEAARLFAGVGEYYIERQDLDQALEFFREAVTLDQKNRNAQNGLSEALALKGNKLLVGEKPSTARVLFEEAVQINPKNAVAYFGLAELAADADRDDAALENYEKALQADKDLTEIYVPLGILYYQKGEIARADELLTKALAAAPNDAETQYFLGLVRYAQNKNAEALTAFRQTIKADPTSPEGHFYAGEAARRLNQNADAVAAYAEAVRLKPKYFEAQFARGNAFYEMENYQEAAKSFEEAKRARNDVTAVYLNLAEAYRQTGKFSEAESNYNLAITFAARDRDYKPDDIAEMHGKIAFVIGQQCEINLRKFAACRWQTAIDSLEKAVALAPNAADYTNLGWAYYNSGKLDLAQKREAEGKAKLASAKTNLQRALALNPKFAEAPLINLGVTEIDLGEYRAAIETLKKVTDKRADWNFAVYALGTAYFKNDDFESAAKMFRRATEKDGNYVAAWSSLGYAEMKRKNNKEVEKIINKLRALNRNEAAKLEAQMKLSGFSNR